MSALITAAAFAALALIALVAASFGPAADLRLFTAAIDNPRVHVASRGGLQAITLMRHRDDVTLRGTATSGTTVTARINGDVVASQYVAPGTVPPTFEMNHVPLPEGAPSLELEAAAWHGLHHSVKRYTYAIENPTAPPFRAVTLTPKEPDGGNVRLSGSGPPNSTIVVYDSVAVKRDENGPPAAELARAHTGEGGTFEVRASLAAGYHRLWAATPRCEQSKCASKPARLFVDRSVPPPARFNAKRALALDVAFKRLTVRIDARIPLDDPRAEQIIAGASGKAVAGQLYDELRINDQPAEALFAGVVPQYAVNGDALSVTLASQTQRSVDPILPVANGPLIITASGAQSPELPSWHEDTVAIAFRDYALSRPLPAPNRSDAHTVAWDRPFDADGGRVVATLSYSPWEGAAAARSLLALPAPELVSEIPSRLLAIVDSLTFSIPMLVYFVVMRRRPNVTLVFVARVLMAVTVSASVFLALGRVQYEFAMRIVRLGGNGPVTDAFLTRDLLVPFVSGMLFAVLAGAVGAIFLSDVRWWAVVVRESFFAVAAAAGLFVVTAVLTFIAHSASGVSFAAQQPPGDPVLLWYLVVATLALTALDMAWIVPTRIYRVGGRRTQIAILAVLCVLALIPALPLTFHQYVVWADQPAFNGTVFSDVGGPTALTLDYLRQAGVLCNFAFGLALLATPLIGRLETGLERGELLKIALCCYAVPATANVMLVPVSFIAAWLTFRWIVDSDPPSDAEAASIRKHRPSLMTAVLLQPRAGDVLAKVQDMTNKYIDGDLDRKKLDAARLRMRETIDAPVSRDVDRVFCVAPGGSAQNAARLGLLVASAFVALHVMLFLSTQTAALRVAHTAFPILVLSSFVATGAAQFMVPAVVYGWCFELIRGRSGLHKAIVVAIWAIACSLPSWVLRLPSANSLIAIVVETALFYTVLGFAFDIAIVREARHSRFRLRDVPALSGVPALSWAGTVLVASAGVALNGVLTGQMQNVVTSTITSVFREATLGQ